MKIEIETKFNLGDEVFIARFNENEKKHIPFLTKINQIEVAKTQCSDDLITLYILDEGDLGYYPEHFLYATKEECQKRCNLFNTEENQ